MTLHIFTRFGERKSLNILLRRIQRDELRMQGARKTWDRQNESLLAAVTDSRNENSQTTAAWYRLALPIVVVALKLEILEAARP